MSGIEEQELENKHEELNHYTQRFYQCNYCGGSEACSYAWDPYNREQTIIDARIKFTCLATK